VRVHDRLFIGGEWVEPAGTSTIEVVSPATLEPVGRTPDSTEADVDRAVAAARQAFDDGPWPQMSPAERADALARLGDGLRSRTDEFAQLITAENGSPITWSTLAQGFAPTMIHDYYVDMAREFPFEDLRQGVLGQVLVRHEPVGVVAAIVPWNAPLFLTMAKISPALAAGCTVVLKPSPETPLNAFLLAEVIAEAGLPPGVVNIVPAGRKASESLVRHTGIDKISFTGSSLTGKRIASLAGEQLKRYSLELGGKSAAVLLDDVDLSEAIPALLPTALMISGQACIAQTRILAPAERYQEVVDALCDNVAAMKMGDPLDPETELGPLIAERQRDRVEGYIASGQEEGAKVVLGGGRPAGLDKGWWVEPTVFVNVDNKMKIAQEEIFGPVLSVIPYSDTDDAVAIANDSNYGLSGTVWTADVDRGLDVARRVRTGNYTINGFTIDIGTPFGGFKESGIGREFGPDGLELFCEKKAINLPAGYTPSAI